MSKRTMKRRRAGPVRTLKLAPTSRSSWRTMPAAMIEELDGAKSDGAKSDGVKSDGAKSDGVKSDGAKSDGVKSDGAQSDGARQSPAVGALPVILIEDNRLLLEGLMSVLSAQGLKVIATARSGSEALKQVARLRPHLVLIDATLGDRDCVHLVEAVKKVFPDMKIIVMHLLPAHSDLVAFVRAGVSGFIMKDATVADIVSTIRTVADGGSVLPPSVTGTLFSHIAEQTTSKSKRAVKAAMRMTPREREIAALVGDGLTNRDIAKQIGVTTRAVRSNVQNILEKMALHTRLEPDETQGEADVSEPAVPLAVI